MLLGEKALSELAEVKTAFDKAYEEYKHKVPTKICGPNLVGILNSAGFYKKEPEMNTKDMQEKAYYEKMVAQREDMRPQQFPPATPTSPIRTAVELMEGRICKLQEVTERLFIRLKPITTNTDDNYPGEPCAAREGNSALNIDLNAMSERIGAITAALQLQIDRLEV